jgi:hypothetical protein
VTAILEKQPVRERGDLGKTYSFGFTGTSKGSGMTLEQSEAVWCFLSNHLPAVLHLGDCINADAQAYAIARSLGIYCVGHPPDNDSKRAFCNYDETRPPRPYLERNRLIVVEGTDGLIAAPKDYDMPRCLRGQGTWSTIHKAIKIGRTLNVFLPDGRRWIP